MSFIKFNFIDKIRLTRKYQKVKSSRGLLFAQFYIVFFTFRDTFNHLILKFLRNTKFINQDILFIEPLNQGFGDLFFQTALFKALNKGGYKISILCNKKHSQILENNEDLSKVYFWDLEGIKQIFYKKNIVIGLGRSTFTETIVLLLAKNKITLDKDLDLWKNKFEKIPNTIAWIEIFEKLLNSSLEKSLPKIYFSKKELELVKDEKSNNKIGVVYGVTDKTKRFNKINILLERIPDNYKIILLGANSHYSGNKKILNSINKSYRENIIEMASCSHVIGTEGSLVHVASIFDVILLVIDEKQQFTKNCHPNISKNVKIFSEGDIVTDLINDL